MLDFFNTPVNRLDYHGNSADGTDLTREQIDHPEPHVPCLISPGKYRAKDGQHRHTKFEEITPKEITCDIKQEKDVPMTR
jgi:hypothetical protein